MAGPTEALISMQVVDWLAKQASLNPGKIALVDLAGGREISYHELNQRASRVAGLIKRWSIAPNARVAVLAHNSIEYIEWLYGCARAQTIMVCLNWRLSANELADILADASPTALVYGPEFALGAQHLAQMQGIGRIIGLAEEYEAALDETSPGPPDWGWREEGEPWYLLYVPGFPARYKGVIHTFGMCFLNAVHDMLAMELHQHDVFLSVLPFHHTSGLNVFLNPMLMVGGQTLIMPQFDAAATITLLQTRTDVFFAVAAIYRFLSQQAGFAEADFSRVRRWGVGATPMSPQLLTAWRERGICVRSGYGLTETGPTVFLADATTAARKPGSVGKPVGTMQCRVIDRHNVELGANQRGELLIRGSGLTPGYWRMPEATAAAFTDGWLRTGDIAYFDDEGDYFIVDRMKNMFISGDEAVYPAEVESVLAEMPEIAENFVFPVSDECWGEAGRALIALRPGMRLDEQQVKAHCRERLAAFKVPRDVEFVSALPRDATGKIDKIRLRAQWAERP